MNVGDLVKSKLGNYGLIVQAYTLDDGFGEQLFVDIRFMGGALRTCFPARFLEVISESR